MSRRGRELLHVRPALHHSPGDERACLFIIPLIKYSPCLYIPTYYIALFHHQAESILNGELDDILFEGIEGGLGLPAKAWASALLEFGTSNVPALSVAVHLRETGQITREGILPLVKESSRRETTDLIHWMISEATSRGFIPANNSEVEDAVDAIMIEKADFISERGMSAVGPLMGLVMQRLGGSADGKIVSQVLRDKISSISDN